MKRIQLIWDGRKDIAISGTAATIGMSASGHTNIYTIIIATVFMFLAALIKAFPAKVPR